MSGAERGDADQSVVEHPTSETGADATLAALYGNKSLPRHFLNEAVPCSAVISACWPQASPQGLLKQSWQPLSGEEGAEDAAPVCAFDPASVEYTELPKRLAKTKVFQDVNRLKMEVKGKELDLKAVTSKKKVKEEDREAAQNAVDEVRAQLDEAQAAFGEVKASFTEDPMALTGWMNALFAIADMGLTTFTVGAAGWPLCAAADAFTEKDGSEQTEGIEKMLAAFQKRYAHERGAGTTQVILRLTPNTFREGLNEEAISAAVTRLLETFGIDAESETPGSLDAVEVGWWASEARSPIAVLRQLAKLCEDQTETDAESGEVTVTAAKQIKALGVYDFDAKAIEDTVKAGVHISFAHISFGLHNASAARKIIAVCQRYGIAVIADGATMHGCLSNDFIGITCPSHFQSDPPVATFAGVRALTAQMGGWPEVQAALKAVKSIAEKHSVTMTSVMLRWQMDQGATPVTMSSWSHPGGCMGKGELDEGPPADAQLFQQDTFLDADDMAALDAVAK